MKLLKDNKKLLPYITEVEQCLKENAVDSSKVVAFIEKFFLVEV